jgi:hypothetical protein
VCPVPVVLERAVSPNRVVPLVAERERGRVLMDLRGRSEPEVGSCSDGSNQK